MSNSQKSTYPLEKYSKANHQTRLQSQTQEPGTSDLEWEHHTPADLQLLLEVKKSHQGSYQSVRLKIVWSKSTEAQNPNGAGSNEDVVYVCFLVSLAPQILT